MFVNTKIDKETQAAIQEESITKLTPTNEDDITHIYHIADIHIRRDNSRYDEYRQIFNKFYKILEKDENITTALLVIAGDILHQKDSLSPDCVELTCEFFNKVSNLVETVVIPGNHDLVENNTNKIGSLGPLINLVKLSKPKYQIFFLEKRGGYEYNNLLFGVTYLTDKTILPATIFDKCSEGKIKIALYHGTINNSKIDSSNMPLESDISKKQFNAYNIAMLGDIHKHQYLGKNNVICYPSSLIQQNIGEELDKHGYVLWNFFNKQKNYEVTSKFVNIPNKYGFITLNINKGILTDKDYIDKIPKFPTIRLSIIDTSKEEENDLIKKLKKEYPNYQKIYSEIKLDNTVINKETKTNLLVTTTAQLNTRIKQYITVKLPQIKNISEIIAINTKFHDQMTTTEKETNKWKIKELTFSNMFCYASNNKIDFTKFNNSIIGLFADNATGKSSLINILLYAIFGKCNTNTIGLLNKEKIRFECKVTLDISGIEYTISRSGELMSEKKKNLTYSVEFIKNSNKEKPTIVNGEQKKDTNQEIFKLIGNYEEYILTSFCLQKSKGFIDIGDNERKNMLMTLLNLDKFDILLEKARDEKKEINIKYKEKQKMIDDILDKTNIQTLEKKLKENTMIKENLNKERIKTESENTVNIKQVKDYIKELIPVNKQTTNLDKLQENNIKLKKEKVKLEDTIERNKKEIKEYTDNILELTKKLDKILKNTTEEIIENSNVLFEKTKQEHIKTLYSKKKPIDESDKSLAEYKKELTKINTNITKLELTIEKNGKNITNISLDKTTINKNYKKYNTLTAELKIKQDELNKIKLEITAETTTSLELSKYKFNKSCTECNNNKIIIDKFNNLQKIEKRTSDKNNIDEEIKNINLEITKLNNPEETYNNYNNNIDIEKDIKRDNLNLDLLKKNKTNILEKIEEIKQQENIILENNKIDEEINSKLKEVNVIYTEYNTIKTSIDKLKVLSNNLTIENNKYITKLYDTNNLLSTNLKNIEINKKYNEDVTHNLEIKKQIDILEKKTEVNKKLIIKNTKQIEDLIPGITKLKSDIENHNKYYIEVTKFSKELEVLETYIKIVNKTNGLPYVLFNEIVPNLEKEINNNLGEFVDFKIKIELEDNKVNIYKIKEDQKHEVILCSGMEKFIIDIAFRIGLIGVGGTSTLNTMFIDEGLSCLDSNNVSKLNKFFEDLKRKFDFILIVSHLHSIKGAANKWISITINKDGESCINS